MHKYEEQRFQEIQFLVVLQTPYTAVTQSAFTFSKLTIETREQGVKVCYLYQVGIFIVNFEHI